MAFTRLAPCTCFTPSDYLHWCERRKQRELTDQQIKEKLEHMATLDDLFNSGKKYPHTVNLKDVGDFVKGVVTKIDPRASVFEWDQANNRPGLQKFWVDGKPKGVPADEAERAGLNPVHQIMIYLSPFVGQGAWLDKAGDEVRVPINSKDERDAFKAAVAAAGGSIDIGDTFGKKLDERSGNTKKHSMKVTRKD